MYKASVTKYNRVSLPSWECSITRSTYQGGRQLTLRKSPKTPESVRKSFKRLYGTHLVIQKRTRNKKQYLFPDVSVSEPIVTSTPIQTVTVETIREYSLTDATTQNDLPYPLTVWSVATSQWDRVGLDVGGKMFFTSRTTLRNYPKSLLFKLVDIHDSLIVYFVDRDPELESVSVMCRPIRPSTVSFKLKLTFMN